MPTQRERDRVDRACHVAECEYGEDVEPRGSPRVVPHELYQHFEEEAAAAKPAGQDAH